jgi:hypothetical protein
MFNAKRFTVALGTAAILMGAATSASASSILLINGATGTSEPGTTAAITTNFTTIATALGHTVTVSDGVPGSFAGFNQVWDFRFSNNFALTAPQITQYVAYLAAGGGMFVMGENAGFATRNNSVLALIAAAGGGSLAFTTPCSTQTVRAPFTGPFPISNGSISYAAPGGVTSPGTGAYMTDCGDGTGTGIFFGAGDLAGAPTGALAAIFDVNWAEGTFDVDDRNYLRNILGGIDDVVNPTLPGVVPEPATFMLTGLGLGALLLARRRQGKRA